MGRIRGNSIKEKYDMKEIENTKVQLIGELPRIIRSLPKKNWIIIGSIFSVLIVLLVNKNVKSSNIGMARLEKS